MIRADQIIPHLQRVREVGHRKWQACCPAHDDTNPSLALEETPDGRLLWHCHAGCSQEAVRDALYRLAGIRPNRFRYRQDPPLPYKEMVMKMKSWVQGSGARLRALRREHNLPIMVLARKAGIAQQHLWLWENYDITPTPEIAQKIADALGVPLDELLEVQDESL